MYSEATLHTNAASAEDALKFATSAPETRDMYDRSLYVESARRVVFKNCMGKCELDDETVPNFNKKFYYAQDAARACLQSCFNVRMQAHFGPAAQQVDGLQFDMDALKKEYQRYEQWHPKARHSEKQLAGFEESRVQDIVSRLKEKSSAGGRFDFQ